MNGAGHTWPILQSLGIERRSSRVDAKRNGERAAQLAACRKFGIVILFRQSRRLHGDLFAEAEETVALTPVTTWPVPKTAGMALSIDRLGDTGRYRPASTSTKPPTCWPAATVHRSVLRQSRRLYSLE